MILYIFVNNILPAFVIIGIGALASRVLNLDTRTPSRMTLYVFVPCLVFSSMIKSSVGGEDIINIFLFLLLTTAGVGACGWATAQLLRLDQMQTNALLLSTMFLNAGNLGLSILLFSYGNLCCYFSKVTTANAVEFRSGKA